MLNKRTGGPEPYIILARGAKVMITRNIWQNQGMSVVHLQYLILALT